MIITTQIEFIDDEQELDCFDAELEGNPVIADDSYDDEFGTVVVPPYFTLDGDVTWKRKNYTDLQNAQIADYIKANTKSIEELFFNAF